MSVGSYPTERVDCGDCDGLGEDIEFVPDPLDWHSGRCSTCFGTGWVEVCANCLDELDGCSVCNPPRAASVAEDKRA